MKGGGGSFLPTAPERCEQDEPTAQNQTTSTEAAGGRSPGSLTNFSFCRRRLRLCATSSGTVFGRSRTQLDTHPMPHATQPNRRKVSESRERHTWHTPPCSPPCQQKRETEKREIRLEQWNTPICNVRELETKRSTPRNESKYIEFVDWGVPPFHPLSPRAPSYGFSGTGGSPVRCAACANTSGVTV